MRSSRPGKQQQEEASLIQYILPFEGIRRDVLDHRLRDWFGPKATVGVAVSASTGEKAYVIRDAIEKGTRTRKAIIEDLIEDSGIADRAEQKLGKARTNPSSTSVPRHQPDQQPAYPATQPRPIPSKYPSNTDDRNFPPHGNSPNPRYNTLFPKDERDNTRTSEPYPPRSSSLTRTSSLANQNPAQYSKSPSRHDSNFPPENIQVYNARLYEEEAGQRKVGELVSWGPGDRGRKIVSKEDEDTDSEDLRVDPYSKRISANTSVSRKQLSDAGGEARLDPSRHVESRKGNKIYSGKEKDVTIQSGLPVRTRSHHHDPPREDSNYPIDYSERDPMGDRVAANVRRYDLKPEARSSDPTYGQTLQHGDPRDGGKPAPRPRPPPGQPGAPYGFQRESDPTTGAQLALSRSDTRELPARDSNRGDSTIDRTKKTPLLRQESIPDSSSGTRKKDYRAAHDRQR